MIKKLKYIVLAICLLPLTANAQNNSEGLKRRAIQKMQAGRFGEAIDLLNKYIAKNARKAEGYNLRGLSFEKRTQYVNAILDFRRAHKLKPNNAEYKKNLDRTITVWHKILRKRIEGFKREIAIDPSNAFNYLEIGKSYRWLEEWKNAEIWYDKYLARDDNASPDEIIRYSIILAKTGSIVKGEKILKKYVERYPNDWRLWSRYGYFTLWLGKRNIAKNAFETALGFKPFFKEAQDGLDLATNKAYITQYQPEDYERNRRRRWKVYPIDRDYRKLKRNPNDDETRFLLVKELIGANRYAEAYDQMQYLKPNYENTTRYQNLWTEISDYVSNKIDNLETKLKEYPTDSTALHNMVGLYVGQERYSEAEELLKEYLDLVPGDADTRFEYAKVLSYDRKFADALEQVTKAIEDNPSAVKYKLLAGQLEIWMNGDLDKSQQYLEDYISVNPNDINALLALGTLYFQKHNFDESKIYADKVAAIDPKNEDLVHLKELLKNEKLREIADAKVARLNKGRELAKEGDYEDALPYYENYLDSTESPTPEFMYELASVYAANKQYEDAISIYQKQLDNNYDYDKDKELAKIYLAAGDSTEALDEFLKLSEKNPDDLETKLYLGDAYFQNKDYDKARKIYLSLEEAAPDSFAISDRLGWLPRDKNDPLNYLLSYAIVNPFGYIFRDNLNFQLLYGGVNLEVGLYKSISITGSWYRGRVSNINDFIDFTTFNGRLNFNLDKFTLFALGYGITKLKFVKDVPFYEGLFIREKKDYYKIAAQYNQGDASLLLYSPELIRTRLLGHILKFNGYYKNTYGLQFYGMYDLIWTDKTATIIDNIGNNVMLRVGKMFLPNVAVGYEYYFSDFKYDFAYYYTPQRFVSHSIWGEWDVHRDKEWEFTVGGQVGYVPSNDYIITQANFKLLYNVNKRLRFNATGFYSNSIQGQVGYKSTSLYVSAFWTIY